VSDDVLFFTGSGEETVVADRVDGDDAWKVVSRPNPDQTVTTWVVPRMNDAVVRIEIANKKAGGSLTRVESLYKQFQGGWYPKTIVNQSFRKGTLQDEERIAVTQAEFGAPIDPSLFTIAGLGPAPGRKISVGPGNRGMVWDGARMIDEIFLTPTAPKR
jgi:hypothetical protein